MTTNTPSPQQMYGTGAPVATAPNGTRYFDTTNPGAWDEYVCVGGTWFNIGGGGIASVTLTSAQVLALETTPINLIPAPAAGQLIIVGNVTYKGTGAYTQADGAGLVYHGLTIGADTSYKNATNPFVNGVAFAGGTDVNASAGFTNLTTALGLGVDIAAITTNPTVGTTPVTVTATYRIITP